MRRMRASHAYARMCRLCAHRMRMLCAMRRLCDVRRTGAGLRQDNMGGGSVRWDRSRVRRTRGGCKAMRG
eukprot:202672-Rhodomonas_salina.1